MIFLKANLHPIFSPSLPCATSVCMQFLSQEAFNQRSTRRHFGSLFVGCAFFFSMSTVNWLEYRLHK